MPALTTLYCPSCNSPISPGTKFCASCGHELAQPDQGEKQDPLIGQFVGGRFLVQAKLGEGGMGAVYQAEQVAMKRPVALKVLHPHLCQDEQLIERFHREAAASSRLNHPNTITVHDFGQTDDGTLYIAMEFVDGRSLADEVKTIASLPWTRAVHIALQIAESLTDAHGAGIVHRDLKPDNVMLQSRAGATDFVKILDFGIAKIADAAEGDDKRQALTKTGMIFGTPQYMSPEQIRGSGVDHRTDIYALGVILYQLLTGELPFQAENPMGLLTKHLMEPPRPMAQARPGLDCPPQLEALVMRCLQKDPAARYQSMAEIVQELMAFAGETRPGFAVQTPAPVGGAAAPLMTAAGGGAITPPTAFVEGTPAPGVGQAGTGFAPQATPASGSFAGMGTGGGLTPSPSVAEAPKKSGAGRTVLLVLLILLLLGGAGVGAAFAWRMMSAEEDGDDDTTTVAGAGGSSQTPVTPTTPQTPQTPITPATPQTPQTPVMPTTPQTPAPPAAQPDAGGPSKTDAAAAPGASPPAKCDVVAADQGKQTKALADAFAQRESQIRLCLNPLASKSFDGRLDLGYRWGRGKGPNAFKASKNTLGDKTLALCIETVVKMVSHPESKRGSKANVSVEAAGGSGAVKSCKVTADVVGRRRKKGGPKPPALPPGTYPTYPGYQY